MYGLRGPVSCCGSCGSRGRGEEDDKSSLGDETAQGAGVSVGVVAFAEAGDGDALGVGQ